MNFNYFAKDARNGQDINLVDHPMYWAAAGRLNNDNRRLPDLRLSGQNCYLYSVAPLAPVNVTQLADCTSVVSDGLVRYDIDLQSRNIDLKAEIEQLRTLVSELEVENMDHKNANRAISSKVSEDWNDNIAQPEPLLGEY
ncbi:unnamed protein product [Macrosiphum euphorbiae]|uniref:Tail fiber domain-containing protein n=1 Tax=Macrosiphum euphorbiae TaxID=13131 RepID=A0AAV0W0T3_9HEMI|nr:unnamed protein product [Macrosiphum euphorbiae]